LPENVARTIRGARAALGLSQQAVADLVGVTRATVSEWERGLSIPRLKSVNKLAKALAVEERFLTPFGGGGGGGGGGGLLPATDATTGIIADMKWDDLNRLSDGESPLAISGDALRVHDPETMKDGDYRLHILDDAMAPIFNVGDRVRMSPNTEPYEGCQVVVWLANNDGGTGILRNWVPRRDGAFDLVAENPNYRTVSCNSTRPGHILGVVTRHVRVLSPQKPD
tara:strand:- start:721 stop:1395 length:675 start_codon:yes stop_codon:yes gene_type:complete